MSDELRTRIRSEVESIAPDFYMLTDAQVDAIITIINTERRRVAELYEEGWVYTGKRGVKS